MTFKNCDDLVINRVFDISKKTAVDLVKNIRMRILNPIEIRLLENSCRLTVQNITGTLLSVITRIFARLLCFIHVFLEPFKQDSYEIT